MTLQDTYRIEIAKWDELASSDRSDESLVLEDADFGAHARRARTMTGIAEFLGDLHGRDVLECGCGLGVLSTLLARSGARVHAFDISPGSIEVARRRAELHGVADSIEFSVAAGEDLPYDDASFDAVVGKAVLHHLDASLAAPELHRVMRPGGRAAFSEPLGTNPLIAFARDHVPYPHKNPRGADEPLTYDDIRAWCAPFRTADHHEIELLTAVRRALGIRRPLPALERMDDRLLARWPKLGRWCRYVVLTMAK
jgi:SAM-dependent methyltransferase